MGLFKEYRERDGVRGEGRGMGLEERGEGWGDRKRERDGVGGGGRGKGMEWEEKGEGYSPFCTGSTSTSRVKVKKDEDKLS